jgi:hypothetical protein
VRSRSSIPDGKSRPITNGSLKRALYLLRTENICTTSEAGRALDGLAASNRGDGAIPLITPGP